MFPARGYVGLVWRSAQSIATPDVIEVDQAGQGARRRGGRCTVQAGRCADCVLPGALHW